MAARIPQLSLALPGTDPRSEGRDVMKRLRADARIVGEPFGLVPADLAADRPDAEHYGICFEDGTIRIRLRHRTTGRLLRYSSLVNTLCHELSHLRHMDHQEEFKALFFQVLGYARERGIYRPAASTVVRGCGVSAGPAAPASREEPASQLSLVLPVVRDFRRRR